jgi:NhaA family Na+:H+ antiporter
MSKTTTAPRPDERALEPALSTPWSQTDRPVPRVIVQPLQRFMHTEVAAGAILLVAAVAALVWANSPWAESYHALWETEVGFEVGGFGLHYHLGHWVNDLLMAVFFFVVGLEIKRELVHGDLRDPRVAALPIIAAVGGMVVPAAIYALLNAGGAAAGGWGIPMATDIAFAVGVLALVGRRAPASLKVFLLTLAVADDIGAIIVIAVFYSAGVQFAWLGAAAGTILAIVALRRLRVRSLVPYAVLAAFLWFAMLTSGVHATIAGVILGLLTPAWPFHKPEAVADVAGAQLAKVYGASGAGDGSAHADNTKSPTAALHEDTEHDEQALLEVSRVAYEGVSPLARLEAKLHPWSAFLILPLFALANAGVAISGDGIGAALGSAVTLGVGLGLLIGKPVGVVLACWLAVTFGKMRLPAGASWTAMAGVGLLAGIGFTVALFVAGLSFTDPEITDGAKVGILAASLLSGVLGASFLALRGRAS